jgi:hypothetical protein
MMKQALKKLIPRPFRRVLGSRADKQLTRPLSTSYQGDNVSVLQCCVSYNKYGGYCLPLSSLHRPAAQKILSEDVWEPDTIEFMRMNSMGDDIVHAGTYYGDFIPIMEISYLHYPCHVEMMPRFGHLSQTLKTSDVLK